MPANDYQSTISWLFEQFPSYQNKGASAYKPGLDHTLKLVAAFGNPHHQLRFIHVAGTNGKGTTCSIMASSLTEAGYRVGLFTSPHLLDFRERIRVNGTCIPEEEVVSFCKDLRNTPLDFKPSFFEITWCMALKHFERVGCDICVIETGLGGRLDSTNIVTPLLSVITNIGLEHTQFLGDTHEAIAGEKGGIIKSGIPVVIGERQATCENVFERIAKERNSSLVFASDHLDASINTPLIGRHQQLNFNTAKHSLTAIRDQLPNWHLEHLLSGLTHISRNTGWRARLQEISAEPRIVIDVAHNVDGIRSVLKVFEQEVQAGSLKIIYGTSSDKNVEEIFALFPKQADYFFTQFKSERSLDAAQLKKFGKKFELQFRTYATVLDAYSAAKESLKKTDTLLIFGSFFLIEDFLKINSK